MVRDQQEIRSKLVFSITQRNPGTFAISSDVSGLVVPAFIDGALPTLSWFFT